MSIVKVWKCDICKEEFKEGDIDYRARATINISIPSTGQYENDETFYFEDVCVSCRSELVRKIKELLEP